MRYLLLGANNQTSHLNTVSTRKVVVGEQRAVPQQLNLG